VSTSKNSSEVNLINQFVVLVSICIQFTNATFHHDPIGAGSIGIPFIEFGTHVLTSIKNA
jgi:hypothetical protein